MTPLTGDHSSNDGGMISDVLDLQEAVIRQDREFSARFVRLEAVLRYQRRQIRALGRVWTPLVVLGAIQAAEILRWILR